MSREAPPTPWERSTSIVSDFPKSLFVDKLFDDKSYVENLSQKKLKQKFFDQVDFYFFATLFICFVAKFIYDKKCTR